MRLNRLRPDAPPAFRAVNTISQHYNTICQQYDITSQHSNIVSLQCNTICQHSYNIDQQ